MKILSPICFALLAIILSGCAGGGGSSSSAQPASRAQTPSGMNANGEVIDSSKVSEGYGKKVSGRGGWTGEILGVPTSGSKFSSLEIGMSVAEVARILGTPTDQGAYLTGQAFNPFNFGSGKSRYEMVYKNQGRLIFDSPSPYAFGAGMGGYANGAFGTGNLVWIIHNSKEPGYR
jgi:hypothetical protein